MPGQFLPLQPNSSNSICVIAGLLVTSQTVCLLVSLLVLLERPDSIWLLSFSCLFELQVRHVLRYNISKFHRQLISLHEGMMDLIYCFSCETLTRGVIHLFLYVLPWLTLYHRQYICSIDCQFISSSHRCLRRVTIGVVHHINQALWQLESVRIICPHLKAYAADSLPHCPSRQWLCIQCLRIKVPHKKLISDGLLRQCNDLQQNKSFENRNVRNDIEKKGT